MTDSGVDHTVKENFKHIDEVIDSRKLLGQYNIHRNTNVHCRYTYSRPSSLNEYMVRYEDTIGASEGDSFNNLNLKKTDSEITIVRVKCSDLTLKRRISKWDMKDIAIPGDGSHLGESPSLVNLVTLVGDSIPFDTEEYLVPLSSWDPYIKIDEWSTDKCPSESDISEIILKPGVIKEKCEEKEKSDTNVITRKDSWTGKISKFIKKHITLKASKSNIYIADN